MDDDDDNVFLFLYLLMKSGVVAVVAVAVDEKDPLLVEYPDLENAVFFHLE